MTRENSGDVTRLLSLVSEGDRDASDRLYDLVYDELRRQAAMRMARESPGHTLQATELANQAYLRLFGGEKPDFKNSRHFFGAAAKAMYRILVEHARRKLRRKRLRVSADLEAIEAEPGPTDPTLILAVHDALRRIEEKDPRLTQLIKLRFFVGLTVGQTAEVLGVSAKKGQRDWQLAKALISRDLADS